MNGLYTVKDFVTTDQHGNCVAIYFLYEGHGAKMRQIFSPSGMIYSISLINWSGLNQSSIKYPKGVKNNGESMFV